MFLTLYAAAAQCNQDGHLLYVACLHIPELSYIA
jgi:hypothetical protein